jgi:hypothetical protein
MTNYELQALLEDTQAALKEALNGLGEISKVVDGVNYRPDASMEETPAYVIGWIRQVAQRQKMIAELRATPARF